MIYLFLRFNLVLVVSTRLLQLCLGGLNSICSRIQKMSERLPESLSNNVHIKRFKTTTRGLRSVMGMARRGARNRGEVIPFNGALSVMPSMEPLLRQCFSLKLFFYGASTTRFSSSTVLPLGEALLIEWPSPVVLLVCGALPLWRPPSVGALRLGGER